MVQFLRVSENIWTSGKSQYDHDTVYLNACKEVDYSIAIAKNLDKTQRQKVGDSEILQCNAEVLKTFTRVNLDQ